MFLLEAFTNSVEHHLDSQDGFETPYLRKTVIEVFRNSAEEECKVP